MTKRHFVALAAALLAVKPARYKHYGVHQQWNETVLAIAAYCEKQFPRFDRHRWLDYIASGQAGEQAGQAVVWCDYCGINHPRDDRHKTGQRS